MIRLPKTNDPKITPAKECKNWRGYYAWCLADKLYLDCKPDCPKYEQRKEKQ